MTVYIVYATIICIVVFYLLFVAYIKFTYPFWSRLNMHHSYNILNSFSREGIISSSPLEKSKWTNTMNIKIVKRQNLSKSQEKEITAFIRKNRVMNKHTVNKLTRTSLMTSLSSHNKSCFVGMYYENHRDYKGVNPIIGLVTARPLSVRIHNKFFTSYFIENLLVRRNQKCDTDKIAPQLIHTIIVEQQQVSSSRTCLFERQGRLSIPTTTLLTYNTHIFSMEKWYSSKLLPASHQLIRIHAKNVHILNEILNNLSTLFNCSILPCWSNILDMIAHRRLIINVVSYNGAILSLYFMRDPCIMYSDQNIIECVAAINLLDTTDAFVLGFNDLLLSMKRDYKNIIIHNLSHNEVLTKTIMTKHAPIDTVVNHLFLYNFIQPSLKNSDCIIIN